MIGIWRRALAQDNGINLSTKGVTSSLVYWADVLYAMPAQEDDSHESVGNEAVTEAGDEDLDWRSGLEGAEMDFVDRVAERLNFEVPSPRDDAFEPEPTEEPGFERIPIPWFIKRRLMKALLRDVHHHLFNTVHSPRPGVKYHVQSEIRDRFIKALREDSEANVGRGLHVVVSHSMGTVIAYDCLKRVPDCPSVDALMTIGSPLGIDEVQDKLKPEWTRDDGYPGTKVSGSWANIFDSLDPVAFDSTLSNDFQRGGRAVVTDQRQRNRGKWRHSIDKYLSKPELRGHLARQLGISWS